MKDETEIPEETEILLIGLKLAYSRNSKAWMVADIMSDSPAENGFIKINDEIFSVNGNQLPDFSIDLDKVDSSDELVQIIDQGFTPIVRAIKEANGSVEIILNRTK